MGWATISAGKRNSKHHLACLWPPLHTVEYVPSPFFASAGTLHQRGSAVPGPTGQHRGGHSLRGGWPDRQLSSAPQLWQGDQREAEDVAFLSGEKKRKETVVSAKWCEPDVEMSV